RRGASIERVARTLGVDANALLRENDIRNRNLIQVGQRLRVPGNDAPAAVLVAAVGDAEDRPPVVLAAAGPDIEPQTARLSASAGPELRGALLLDPSDGLRQAVPSALDGDAEDDDASRDANALASHQADLAADPSDYSVSSGAIAVQPLETLGHYADWLGVRTQRLRDLNGLQFGQNVVLGQALRLDFSSVTPEEFEQRRIAYHRQHQEEFFSSHHIDNVENHVIRSGESLWVLAQRTYNVPVWLLRQYNPDLDLDRVTPGTVVKFPRLRPIDYEGQLSR